VLRPSAYGLTQHSCAPAARERLQARLRRAVVRNRRSSSRLSGSGRPQASILTWPASGPPYGR